MGRRELQNLTEFYIFQKYHSKNPTEISTDNMLKSLEFYGIPKGYYPYTGNKFH